MTWNKEKQNVRGNGPPYCSDIQRHRHATLFNADLTRRRNEATRQGEIREYCEDTDISLYIKTLHRITHQQKLSCLPIASVIPSGKGSSRQWKRLFRMVRKPLPYHGKAFPVNRNAPFRLITSTVPLTDKARSAWRNTRLYLFIPLFQPYKTADKRVL